MANIKETADIEAEIKTMIAQATTDNKSHVVIKIPDGWDKHTFRTWLETRSWLANCTICHFREDSTIQLPK